jgi:succinyl-diaminopimelate desuccinylase
MKMQELYPTPNDETKETTVSLTSIISSGDSYSQTPGTATARFDTRYTIGDTNFGSKEGARKLVAQLDSDAKIIEFLAFSAPVNTSPTNPLLLDLKAAAEKIEKHAFTFVQRKGTSVGRHYGEVGDEACEFGVVGAGQHSDNEYVSVEAIDNYQKTMHHFLENTIQSEQGNFQGATG